jgi:hypothetical protein
MRTSFSPPKRQHQNQSTLVTKRSLLVGPKGAHARFLTNQEYNVLMSDRDYGCLRCGHRLSHYLDTQTLYKVLTVGRDKNIAKKSDRDTLIMPRWYQIIVLVLNAREYASYLRVANS